PEGAHAPSPPDFFRWGRGLGGGVKSRPPPMIALGAQRPRPRFTPPPSPLPLRGGGTARRFPGASNAAKRAAKFRSFRLISRPAGAPAASEGSVVKVIASDVRKGNVLEHEDGKLYVVMSHETFRPGKGTPTTTIVMRRIIDGVKTTAVFKTTDALEKAFVEQIKHTYLFDDGDAGLVFMNPDTYEQVHLSRDMVGDSVAYLQPEMVVDLTMFEGQALSIELPPRIIATIETTEPVVKGQTASSSYKPAMLDIGVKTMVPPHIDAGTRVVISTEDGSYVERAKD